MIPKNTNMHVHSLDAYFGTVLPKIGKNQSAVFEVFTENPLMNFTNKELSIELGWPINSVTPRTHELRGKNKRFPELIQFPLLVDGEKRKSRLYRDTEGDMVFSKLNHMAWQINPNRRPRR